MAAPRATAALLGLVLALSAGLSPAAASRVELHELAGDVLAGDHVLELLQEAAQEVQARPEPPGRPAFTLWPAPPPENGHLFARAPEPPRLELALPAPSIASEIVETLPETRIRAFGLFDPILHPGSNRVSRENATGYALGLWRNRVGPTQKGLWTDPVTGHSYARARWLDTRNASWLSEDPLGDVDSTNLYAFVGWQPNMGTDPLGTKTMLFVGENTIGVLPQLALTTSPDEEPSVDLNALSASIDSAVGEYWGTQQFDGHQVLFDVAILNTQSSGVRSAIIRRSRSRPGSYPYYFWVQSSLSRPRPGVESESDLLWSGASAATLAHEAGHWMHWRYQPKDLEYPFSEGYLIPDGYYPAHGIMESGAGRRVTSLDVGAVLVRQGEAIGEFNGHEIVAGYRSESRSDQGRIRDDLLVDRFSVYDGRSIRKHLKRQYDALVAAGYEPQAEYVELLRQLVQAFRSDTEKGRVEGVMGVFKRLAEVESK